MNKKEFALNISQVFSQFFIGVAAIYISYQAYNSDTWHKERQEQIELIDRAKELDSILTGMKDLLSKLDEDRLLANEYNTLLLLKYHSIFEKQGIYVEEQEYFKPDLLIEKKLAQVYKRIIGNVDVLRMRYGIYFPILLQQFTGNSHLMMTDPENEERMWQELANKMQSSTLNLRLMDFCLEQEQQIKITDYQKHYQHCAQYRATITDFSIGNRIPYLTSISNIISVNSVLLQDYADHYFGSIQKNENQTP